LLLYISFYIPPVPLIPVYLYDIDQLETDYYQKLPILVL
jgi:hypothetical protein